MRTVADVTRLLSMSVADLLDDWFESPQVKGALALNGVIGTWAGPCEPGTAYVMADQSIGDVGDGHLGSWGFPEGGMGAVATAIERSAVAAGARVRTSAPVEQVLVRDGTVAAVVLRGGEEIEAAAVVSSVHPRIAFLEHVEAGHLPDDFVGDIRRWKSRSGVVKINLAVAELPDFTADPGTHLQDHHTGSIGMAPTVEYIERAFQEAREGRPSQAPFSDGVIPTTLDRSLAPEGTHIVSLFTQWVPASWCEEPHREELEAYADRIIDLYDQVAPNFKASIRHRDVLGPYDLEHEYGLVGGNIFHGELSLDQLFHLRPAPGYSDYRTPIRGLYYASSATHPAGGVSGIPGRHAAHALLADRRRRARSRLGRAAPRWPTRNAGGHDQ